MRSIGNLAPKVATNTAVHRKTTVLSWEFPQMQEVTPGGLYKVYITKSNSVK